MACLQVSSQAIFSVNKYSYNFFLNPAVSHVFHGPEISGPKLFKVQVFQGPEFLGFKFFWVQLFEGSRSFGSRSRFQGQDLGPGFKSIPLKHLSFSKPDQLLVGGGGGGMLVVVSGCGWLWVVAQFNLTHIETIRRHHKNKIHQLISDELHQNKT